MSTKITFMIAVMRILTVNLKHILPISVSVGEGWMKCHVGVCALYQPSLRANYPLLDADDDRALSHSPSNILQEEGEEEEEGAPLSYCIVLLGKNALVTPQPQPPHLPLPPLLIVRKKF